MLYDPPSNKLPFSLSYGCLSIQLILDWLEIPTEIVDQYFSSF